MREINSKERKRLNSWNDENIAEAHTNEHRTDEIMASSQKQKNRLSVCMYRDRWWKHSHNTNETERKKTRIALHMNVSALPNRVIRCVSCRIFYKYKLSGNTNHNSFIADISSAIAKTAQKPIQHRLLYRSTFTVVIITNRKFCKMSKYCAPYANTEAVQAIYVEEKTTRISFVFFAQLMYTVGSSTRFSNRNIGDEIRNKSIEFERFRCGKFVGKVKLQQPE